MLSIILSFCILTYNSIMCFSVPEEAISTNEIANWPIGPSVNAKAAFLMEANTGVILYAKNIHEHLYPASTTKIMTALLAARNSKMDEMVTFSYDAVFSLEPGSSNIGIDPGQAMPMNECLYGIMVGSANEVANAVAEHVAGSIDAFVDMMNQTVNDLGLTDTHFTNTNGLHDENHYTSAYDLAIIAREFFENEQLLKIGNTPRYHFEPTDTQPDDFYIKNKHKLINGEIPYPGIKGGKTGYTSQSNETLVTCAEQNGMKLICVVLYDDSPEQFNDTVKLFDYGFSNFEVSNISENESKYSIKSADSFPSTVDIIGNSEPILEINPDDYIIIPKNITFDDLTTEVDYETADKNKIANLKYSYHGAYLGTGSIDIIDKSKITSAFDASVTAKVSDIDEEKAPIIFINVMDIVGIMVVAGIFLIIISFIHSFLVNYNLLDNFRERRKNKKRRNRRDSGSLKF